MHLSYRCCAALFAALCLFVFGQGRIVARLPIESEAYSPVRARHGMVASSDEIASRVGVEILKRGGNAVDAAVAVGLALSVTWPEAGNLGGGGFMIVHTANGINVAIDYREVAPSRAHRTVFLDEGGNVIPNASTVGYRAVAVPGTVAGLSLALEKYGTMKWKELVEPARVLASRGFIVSHPLSQELRNASKLLLNFSETRHSFLKEGRPYSEGETFKQPELAKTLRRLQEEGPREFYEGETARLIAQDMSTNGGLITLEDLKEYKAALREPLHGTYRGFDIITMPPPSSGGIALLEMLNILENYDLSHMGHSSSEKYHLMIEAMRRSFADRAEFLGDPDFVRLPLAGLISKQYAREVSGTIDSQKATPSARVGHGTPGTYEPRQTTHYTVVDGMGNAVSNTYTLNGRFGSGVTVRGGGFLLNNEMDDFVSKAGTANTYGLIQGETNAIVGKKRPASSMTPTILLKDGRLILALGSQGGPTIITQVLQVLINIIDHKMNLQQAVNAPRLHHQWLPDIVNYEPYGLARDVVDALSAKGHRFGYFADDMMYMGDVESVMVEPGTATLLGASDPRNPGARAVGY